MQSHVQVAVIGGGVVGCSVLYHLTRLGWRDAFAGDGSADRSRRSHVADTIEHGNRYARAGRLHGVPVMPPWS